MSSTGSDKVFAGSIPKIYNTYLVPMLFEPFARDIVARLTPHAPHAVLELAAGTGVVTRLMASTLPATTTIVATDLNQPMLDQAAALGSYHPVEWRQADAMALPFVDASFDAVVCQFGVMFFPDKTKAFAEAKRVLKPGGVLLFNVWDRIEGNPLAETATNALAAIFPDDPPRFMARTPHGYYDIPTIRRDLTAGGFDLAASIETMTLRAHAASARDVATAYCQGTPMRAEIEARDPHGLDRATDAAAAALTQTFGAGPIDAEMNAHVVTVRG